MKKHKVTACKREDVMRMAGNGHSQEAIASLLKISSKTLTRRYKNELMDGETIKHEAIMSRLQQQGASNSKSSPAAQQRMFLARARGFGNNLPSKNAAAERVPLDLDNLRSSRSHGFKIAYFAPRASPTRHV